MMVFIILKNILFWILQNVSPFGLLKLFLQCEYENLYRPFIISTPTYTFSTFEESQNLSLVARVMSLYCLMEEAAFDCLIALIISRQYTLPNEVLQPLVVWV